MAAENVEINIILVGGSGVGKTQLKGRFCRDHFSLNEPGTVGVESEKAQVLLGADQQQHITAILHDTAGQERFKAVGTSYYRKSQGAMLVYDAYSRDTFNELRACLRELRANAPESCPVMLLANKADKVGKRIVKPEEGLAFANKHNIAFMEVSALSGIGVKEAFHALLSECLRIRTEAPTAAAPGSSAAESEGAAHTVTIAPAERTPPAAPGCC